MGKENTCRDVEVCALVVVAKIEKKGVKGKIF